LILRVLKNGVEKSGARAGAVLRANLIGERGRENDAVGFETERLSLTGASPMARKIAEAVFEIAIDRSIAA